MQNTDSGVPGEDGDFTPEYVDTLLTDLEGHADEFLGMKAPTQKALAEFLSDLQSTRVELERIVTQLDDQNEIVQSYKSRMTDLLFKFSNFLKVDLVSPAQESVRETEEDMEEAVPASPDGSRVAKVARRGIKKAVQATLKDSHIGSLEEAWAESETRAIRAQLIGDYGFLTREEGENRMDAVLDRRVWSFKEGYREKGPDKKGVSVVLLDIDLFKIINDTMGHDVGDVIIRKCAEIVSKRTRPKDILVRWGGEELIVVLDEVMEGEAIMVAEELRRMIEAEGKKIAEDPEFAEVLANRKTSGIDGCLSVSQGLSFFPDAYEEGDTTEKIREKMVKIADDALYAAKDNGRNVVAFSRGGQTYRVLDMKRIPQWERKGEDEMDETKMDEGGRGPVTKVALLYSKIDDPEGEEILRTEFTIGPK